LNTHALKIKKKNINHQLGNLYAKKIKLNKQIEELEQAKLDVKIILHNQIKKGGKQ